MPQTNRMEVVIPAVEDRGWGDWLARNQLEEEINAKALCVNALRSQEISWTSAARPEMERSDLGRLKFHTVLLPLTEQMGKAYTQLYLGPHSHESFESPKLSVLFDSAVDRDAFKSQAVHFHSPTGKLVEYFEELGIADRDPVRNLKNTLNTLRASIEAVTYWYDNSSLPNEEQPKVNEALAGLKNLLMDVSKLMETGKLPPHSNSRDVVLESFDGFVDSIVDDEAQVTLLTESGEILYGRYPAHELQDLGIAEGTRFSCKTIQTDRKIVVQMTPVPMAAISGNDIKSISREIDELFLSDTGSDD